jgi:hypothetical protein
MIEKHFYAHSTRWSQAHRKTAGRGYKEEEEEEEVDGGGDV